MPITQLNNFEKNKDDILTKLLKPKKHISNVPSHTPTNIYEQFEIYENGTTRRLYVYVNGSWRYVNLT